MTLFPGVLERLTLDNSHVIALGTLRLDTIIRPSTFTTEEEQQQSPVASTSTAPATIWQTYTPGLFQDLADIRLATRKKLSQAAKGGRISASASYSGTPTSPRRSVLKRKRSTTSSNESITPSNATEDQVKVLPPTLSEIDHLVKNAFIAVQYTFIDASCSVKQEDNHEDLRSEAVSPCLFRIYAVPFDAPGLNSRIEALQLKIRSKSTKALAHKSFTKLLYHLHYDIDEWRNGQSSLGVPPYLLTRNSNALSILEVYNKLEDPKPQTLEGVSSEAQGILDDILREDAPEGMSSRLYDFQKTCLWKLASRELAPQRRIDLSFSEHSSIDNNSTYYIDSNSMIWNTAQYYLEPKSAIVSEGMGTGKTCICLALILVFKYRLVEIDDEIRNDSFGRISGRRTARSEAFPWVRNDDEDEEEALSIASSRTAINARDRNMEMLVDASRTLKKVPTLYDLTLDLISCSTHFRSLKRNDSTSLQSKPVTIDDLPYVWEIPKPKQRDDTRSSNLPRRKVYLSSSTLIIVPDILISQWLAEISKHVEEGALDYVKVEKDDQMPSEIELCKLDLVLVSESKIRMEENRFWSTLAPVCRCPYIGNTREIACRCKKVVDHGISPLVGVWWKRLIVDEGHKVAGNGELVQLCMRLRTESRYVVSGTPSKNLVGLHDVGTVEQQEHQTESSVEGGDKNDFERLAKICNFIGMQPFASEPGMFMKTFHDPVTMRGDTSRIEAFFARTMVRHKVPDVAMPPLTRRTVVLEFNELERITYNVLLALFISNSVLSERQDEDYFFHPKNKGHLSSLLSNLGAAHLLFSSAELIKSAQNSYTNNIKAIAINEARMPHLRWSQADNDLIHQAQWCFIVAFDSVLWKSSQKGSMLYSLQGREVNPELLKAYDGLNVQGVTEAVFTGEKLTSLRYQIGKLARDEEWELRSGEELEEELITIALKEKQRMIEESQLNRDRTKPAKGSKPTPVTKTKKKPVKRPTNKDKVSATKAASGAFKKNAANAKDIFTYQHLPLTSHLDQVMIPSVASTKVAYVVKSILEHPTEKFLVFAGGSSSSAHVASNNLFYLAEGLDLANVPFLIFARTLSQEKLAAYAKAFSESTVFRVLLLDLKFAGRGLTLSKATRIIFTEPVWHKDEEAQAVKRAHRLGQDKPVHVETLVMKDSFEEKVMLRGAQLSRRETAGAKTPYQDTQLSAALRALTFLPDRQEEMEPYLTPLQPPLRLIPSFLHDSERQDLDIELARFRQQAQDDLAAQLENHSRGGSASRSRSSTPTVKQERQSSAMPEASQQPNSKARRTQGSPLQADLGYRSARPLLPSALKQVTNARPIESDILMSARISDDTSSDEDVVVVTSRRAGVHFA